VVEVVVTVDVVKYQTLIPDHGPSRVFAGEVMLPLKAVRDEAAMDFLADLDARRREEQDAVALAREMAEERRVAEATLARRRRAA
jgi:hypothetical protein